jgi:hypothetical protein
MPQDDWPLAERERELLRTARSELAALALADEVSRLLAKLVQRVTIDATQEDRSPEDFRRHALWFMAIIVLRALRAAMQVLSVGYDDQSLGYQRLIDELHNRAQKVREDKSGEYARQWLDGRSLGKGAKLAGQEFWEFLSRPVHGNARAVLDWLAITQDDGSAKVVIGPERRPEVTNAALTYMASEARDIANLLAIQNAMKLDLGELDARIHQAFAKYIPDESGETKPTTTN